MVTNLHNVAKRYRHGSLPPLASLICVAVLLGCDIAATAAQDEPVAGACQPTVNCNTFPVPPFSTALGLGNSSTEVSILQFMLRRAPAQQCTHLNISGIFDSATASCLAEFQTSRGLRGEGTLTPETACTVLMDLSADDYKDDGKPAVFYNRAYKILVPVYRNRSQETVAELQRADGQVAIRFRVRLHGFDFAASNGNAWPSFNNSGCGLSSFAANGNTPTGLFDLDLNSAEPIPKEYGKWPVNRVVSGRAGNGAFLIPTFRYGLLLHTGEWSQYSGWQPPQPMPNSEGCIHAWPAAVEQIATLLQEWGVAVRPNPFGKLPYPFQPQGLLSVYEI